MNDIDVVTIGWLTLDDIVLPDGTCQQNVVGGGALYSAIGARIWKELVGIHSAAGRAHIERIRTEIEAWGIDASGIAAIDGNGLQLWVLHETETEKQQIPKLSSSTATEMDRGRGDLLAHYRSARGFHIAPQGSASTLANIAKLANLPSRPTVTLDLLADAYVDPARYADLSFLRSVSAFLPSDAEIGRLWQVEMIEPWMTKLSREYGCCIAAKLGDSGSLVYGGEALHHVPIVPVRATDTTGAGDGFCGGFLAGLVDGRSPIECAAMGTVSASFIVEARGALATRKPSERERDDRLTDVISRIRSQLG